MFVWFVWLRLLGWHALVSAFQRKEFPRLSTVAPAAAAVGSNADVIEAERPLDGNEPIVPSDPPGSSDVHPSANIYLVVHDGPEGTG